MGHEYEWPYSYDGPWSDYVSQPPPVPKPNGLDNHDLKTLATVINHLDCSGAEFSGTANITSQDRTIQVRIWHDSEVHRLEVIES